MIPKAGPFFAATNKDCLLFFVELNRRRGLRHFRLSSPLLPSPTALFALPQSCDELKATSYACQPPDLSAYLSPWPSAPSEPLQSARVPWLTFCGVASVLRHRDIPGQKPRVLHLIRITDVELCPALALAVSQSPKNWPM
jgi:hypothetical protein